MRRVGTTNLKQTLSSTIIVRQFINSQGLSRTYLRTLITRDHEKKTNNYSKSLPYQSMAAAYTKREKFKD